MMIGESAIERQSHSSFNNMPSIDNVKPVDEHDFECLKEIRNVLNRYGMLDRFGITLLHKHFELEEGEIVVESTDEDKRYQILEPQIAATIDPSKTVQTQFALRHGECFLLCQMDCVISNNKHTRSHVTYGG